MKRLMDKTNACFAETIMNGMQDWVRVIDLENNIIYANNALKKELGDQTIGKKCYEAIGKSAPCDDCISKQAVRTHEIIQKEEEINGRIYSVMSSPLKNIHGEVEAVVEVLRDITQEKLMQEKIKMQNKKMKHDLQIAKAMQYNLLPNKVNNKHVEFTYTYMPCEAIGGDFFDIYEIDSSHIGVYVADVSGHGVPASMLTMFLRQSINKNLLSPASVLEDLFMKFNEVKFNDDFYITMFYAVIDTKLMKIKYSNAGHHALPILLNNEELALLSSSGIPISNWIDVVKYEEYEKELLPKDRIVFYTDGLTEISNNLGKRYGELKLHEFILNNRGKHIEELKKLIVEDVSNFRIQGKTQINKLEDDLSMLIVEIKG